MEKTAVDEYYFLMPNKDDIGMAGKVAFMEGVTITHSMDDYFGGSVFTLLQENACT